MDYFKDYTPQDLLDIQDMDRDAYNEFVGKHHYAVCSACGKEYRYEDSPILTDSDWEKVKEYFGLTENEELKTAMSAKTGSDRAKLMRVNNILQTYSDSCLVCRECMEKALGRKLHMEDVVQYEWNKNIFDGEAGNVTDIAK